VPRARYYTPQLDRDLVTSLYHTARARRLPMTKLASALVREGLARMADTDGSAAVREEPPAPDPGGRRD
jgi:hypothetical protein